MRVSMKQAHIACGIMAIIFVIVLFFSFLSYSFLPQTTSTTVFMTTSTASGISPAFVSEGGTFIGLIAASLFAMLCLLIIAVSVGRD